MFERTLPKKAQPTNKKTQNTTKNQPTNKRPETQQTKSNTDGTKDD